MKCYHCTKEVASEEYDRELGVPCCSDHGDGPCRFKLVKEYCPSHQMEIHFFRRWKDVGKFLMDDVEYVASEGMESMGLFALFEASPIGWISVAERFINDFVVKRPERN